MTYPKKLRRRSRALRTLKIGTDTFRWRFHPGAERSELFLHGSISSGQPLTIVLPEWRDPWLNISGFRVDGREITFETAAANEPALMTPSFVRLAILAGIAKGWKPERRGPRLYCIYSQGDFSELSPGDETSPVPR